MTLEHLDSALQAGLDQRLRHLFDCGLALLGENRLFPKEFSFHPITKPLGIPDRIALEPQKEVAIGQKDSCGAALAIRDGGQHVSVEVQAGVAKRPATTALL